jgi:glycosyltransferase involved in cell wall biosynthesis
VIAHIMRFSISLPVLGQADLLPSALASLAAQSEPFDVAILDATADDSSQEVVAKSGLRVAYNRHGPDRGQADAIAEGWGRLEGDVVGWLCADDYYYPDTFARVAKGFAEDPSADVVFGHAIHINRSGDFLEYFPSIDDPMALRRGCCIPQPSCFVRRAAVTRVNGLDTSRHYTMDWDLWLRLLRSGAKFRFIDAPLAATRVYPETKTLSGASERYREIWDLLSQYASWPERVKSLIGFRYYDLVHRQTGPLRTLSSLAFATAKRVRRLLGKPRERHTVFGLECWTNRVEKDCEVAIPWWGPGIAKHAMILTDQIERLDVVINDLPVNLSPSGKAYSQFGGREVIAHSFRVHIPRTSTALVRFRLSANTPWTLYEISLSH